MRGAFHRIHPDKMTFVKWVDGVFKDLRHCGAYANGTVAFYAKPFVVLLRTGSAVWRSHHGNMAALLFEKTYGTRHKIPLLGRWHRL